MQDLLRPTAHAPTGGPAAAPPVAEAALEVATDPKHARADAAHARFAKDADDAACEPRQRAIDRMFETLAAQPAHVLEVLEHLDDLVFAAIGGDEPALAELQVLWPTAAGDLAAGSCRTIARAVSALRLSIWSEAADARVRQPEKAISAIDVLCVLFDE